jgi:hypothetical protein
MEILHTHNSEEIIDLDALCEGLLTFGYQDLKLPKPKKNFDFSKLHAKSILIMNKLANFILEHLEVPLRQLRLIKSSKYSLKERFSQILKEVIMSKPIFKPIIKKALIKIGVSDQ